MNGGRPANPRLWIMIGMAVILLVIVIAMRFRDRFPAWDRGKAADEAAMLAIDQVLNQQVEAWNEGRLEDFMAGYWNSDELTFFSGNKQTNGWQETLERYQKGYQEMGTLTFSDVSIELLSSTSAVVRGRWKVVLKKETRDGLFTLIFKKTRDGWRIVHDHTSTEPPKRAQPP